MSKPRYYLLLKPRKHQTNGMVERFNQKVSGRISEALTTTGFDKSQDEKEHLERYLHIYDHQIPQKILGYRSSAQVFTTMSAKKPDLFYKSEYNHTKPNILLLSYNWFFEVALIFCC